MFPHTASCKFSNNNNYSPSTCSALSPEGPRGDPRQTQPRRICSPLGTRCCAHICFTYANAGQYLINIGWIYPEGYGKNSTAFSTLGPAATAEFVVENERVVGFRWDDISDCVKREGPVKETSDVWFVKQAWLEFEVRAKRLGVFLQRFHTPHANL